MRFLVLGAGAIGGYFGARLIEGGSDVTFLVRERRKALLEKSGLSIRSKYGDFSRPVSAVNSAEAAKEQWDVIIVACKAYDLPSAIHTIGEVIKHETAVLPLLNGLAHIDLMNAEFGRERVLGGLAKIAATLRPDGVIEHLNDWRYVTFGEQSGEITPRVEAILGAFTETGVVPRAVPNIMHMMWEKLVHLATVAGMTSLMRASIGQIAATSEGSDILIDFLHRNARVAASAGFKMSNEFFLEFEKLFRDKTSTYKASMLRDIEGGKPIEADHIIGYVLKAASRYGIDNTVHRLVYANLQAYEECRLAKVDHNAK
jgi:2-dehydropantoate 2-reductase